MITPEYARACIDELNRLAPRPRLATGRPSTLSRLLRRLAR